MREARAANGLEPPVHSAMQGEKRGSNDLAFGFAVEYVMLIMIFKFFNDGLRERERVLPGWVRVLGYTAWLLGFPLEGRATATPHVLPFTYPYATLGEGETELEAITDVNMLRVYADPGDPTKGKLFEPQYLLTTEYEYGINDRVELGLYQAFSTTLDGGNNSLGFDGLKWRVRARLAEAGQWPVDVSLYFELETMHDEVSFEEKLNLEKDFGNLRWMANLWVEEPIERPWDTPQTGQKLTFVINPTTGLSYQFTPSFHLGVEYWARGMPVPVGQSAQDRDNNAVHHFVGPAVNVNFGKVWFAVALYHQITSFRAPEPVDAYGQFWGRAMFGIEL